MRGALIGVGSILILAGITLQIISNTIAYNKRMCAVTQKSIEMQCVSYGIGEYDAKTGVFRLLTSSQIIERDKMK